MHFDIFFSICQTDVDNYIPSEKEMFQNFFDQVKHADQLGFTTAWIAETHLSTEIQKQNPNAVVPHFKGEIGLNTDILQMAHKVFASTKRIYLGSAIRNILCNGGPMAHAEAIRMFLSLHGLEKNEKRCLNIGFAAGRFEFSNIPYGIRPRNKLEEVSWPVLKGKIFKEAVEIFLRFLRGDVFSSKEIAPKVLERKNFRTQEHWDQVLAVYGKKEETITIPPQWTFDTTGVIPKEAPLDLLQLTIGSHNPEVQAFANTLYPCGVFNLSITPFQQITQTHERMKKSFHTEGGSWKRQHMPRTVLIFINDDAAASEEEKNTRAKKSAEKALANYWNALEGTLDIQKVESAVNNALMGSPSTITQQIKERFHKDDRLMLWFDFNNHNNKDVKANMAHFMEKVAPHISS